MQHALYHPGLLGALGTGSEEIIHEGRIYKALWTRQTSDGFLLPQAEGQQYDTERHAKDTAV